MGKVTENEMIKYIENKEPFTGSSVSATLDNGVYSIFSYSTKIYSSDGYFDNKKYSSTTSKIQNMCIFVFGLNNGSMKRDSK